jgi:hypothetical protein
MSHLPTQTVSHAASSFSGANRCVRLASRAWTFGAVLFFIGIIATQTLGCSDSVSDDSPQAGSGPVRKTLSGEEARKALLILAGQKDAHPSVQNSVGLLKDGKIEVVDSETIAIGNWECKLRRREFWFFVEHGRRGVEVFGTFQQKPEGTWMAIVNRVEESDVLQRP